MDEETFVLKIIPACLITLFMFLAAFIFTLKYVYAFHPAAIVFDNDEQMNRFFFYLNFYVPFSIASFFIYALLFSSEFFTRGICVIFGLASVILCVYILEDLFTIMLCLWLSYLIALAVVFTIPKNIYLIIGSITLFVYFQFHPEFMGHTAGWSGFEKPAVMNLCVAAGLMLTVSSCVIIIRTYADKYLLAKKTAAYLNQLGMKLTLFNHKLQELARSRSEEAIKEERLRLTRDLHDSCGYAFTNIIAVTDAAVSLGTIETDKAQEIFQQLRNLASEGIKQTRETLHAIREIRESSVKSIETVFQLAKIFEEVSGVSVFVAWGNMKQDYGFGINKILVKIIQEAFTNSIRHGHATRINIQFWEFERSFTMTVTDNGIGAQVVVKGIGLVGMEERLEAVGGSLKVSLPEDGGFRLSIIVPLFTGEYHEQ
ncbi:MAG: histidine kinase [Treponema sp.]|jgi:signal transduction histidine kinase|nr:histidine kinase [Treponema sp.]